MLNRLKPSPEEMPKLHVTWGAALPGASTKRNILARKTAGPGAQETLATAKYGKSK